MRDRPIGYFVRPCGAAHAVGAGVELLRLHAVQKEMFVWRMYLLGEVAVRCSFR